MTSADERSPSDITLAVRNEAAAWIVQLNDRNRGPHVHAALRRWLTESAEHREAFEIASDLWHAGADLPVSTVGRLASKPRARHRPWLAAAAALAGLVTIGSILHRLHESSLMTAVGEQRSLTLNDGTRVMLNTDTHLRVHYDGHIRRVELKSGEALFEVAKSPRRPFIVDVADRQITALGTVFLVRHDRQHTEVTLVEGKVAVSASLPSIPLQQLKRGGPAQREDEETRILSPGQRLTLAEHSASKVDRPPLEKITAWKHGQAAFQNTPLPEAIEEMNRYSERKIAIGDGQAAALHVSGIFRVGESETFVLALANTYPVRVVERGTALVVYGQAR